MKLSRVYLRWYKSFNIDYTGRAGGDRVASKRPWSAWTLNGATVELPFVEIPIEPEITTVVGGNESGKSHLLSAISNVLSGHSIPVDPFSSAKAEGRPFSQTDLCHFALPLTKNASLWPQLGVELSGLSRERFKSLTGIDAPRGNDIPAVQLFLARDGDKAAAIYAAGLEEPRRLTVDELTALRPSLPQVHFINSQLPLADEVHLEDLIQGYGQEVDDQEPFFDTRALLEFARSLMKTTVPAVGAATPKEFSDEVQSWKNTLAQSSHRRAQELQLEVKLFKDVLGIPKEALIRLYQLKDDDKSHAAAIVSKWSEELERVLNLSRYWQQDQAFSIQLRYQKRVISFEITDKTQKTYTFKERSSGLRYFLSYYIQAKAIEKLSKEKPVVVLMDEPDSFLSIAGQRNLLAVFESLVRSREKDRPQIIYTTHSPFLIHRNFPRRIRLVRKGDAEEGTQLVDKARERRFEPIRSALGIELSQTLFMGAINIVTEGPTDQYFIAEAIRLFAPETAAADLINLNEVVIVSAESASGVYKVVSASQWADELVPTAIVLLDQDDAGRTERERLTGRIRNTPKILDEESILFVGRFIEGSDGASVQNDVTTEDLVPTKLFLAAVRSYIDRWLFEESANKEGLSSLLTVEAFAGRGHVSAARAVFDLIRGTNGAEYDKLGVFEELFDLLWKNVGVDAADRELLKCRVVRLCHALRERIELSTKAERQQTGVQAIKRLIGDFFLQHQQAPPATLDLELKLSRLASEASTFGAADGSTLSTILSSLIAEARAIRQGGRNELSPEDWERWRGDLQSILQNPLNPSLGTPSTSTAQAARVAGKVARTESTRRSSIDEPVKPKLPSTGRLSAEADPSTVDAATQ